MSDLFKNRCIQILLFLKESNLIFQELIRLIVYYVYHLDHNHKLIFYDTHSNYMRLGWNTIQSYPYMTLYHIKDNYSSIPLLIRKLFPCDSFIMFIPNDCWNYLLKHPELSYSLEIKIYNGYMKLYDGWKKYPLYDPYITESYQTWIINCLRTHLLLIY